MRPRTKALWHAGVVFLLAMLWAAPALGWTRPAVETGLYHSVGLRTDGTAVATGWNDDEQCNVSTWTNLTAISGGSRHTLGLKSGGTVVATGSDSDGQCNVTGWTGITAIATGTWHSLGLKADGTVVAAGRTAEGQGSVSSWAGIKAVCAGSTHTLGLKSDGTVVACGSSQYGQSNVAPWTGISAISAGQEHSVGLKSDGTVVATGTNTEGQCNVSSWTNIVAISAGGFNTVGLKSDGTVVATGRNSDGQLNVSTWTNVAAISVYSMHTLGLKYDGAVVGTGNIAYGQAVPGWNLLLQTRPISQANVAPIAPAAYTGSPITPTPAVTDGGRVLAAGAEYTVGYSNNVNAGTGSAVMSGHGFYSGQSVVNFQIDPKPLAASMIGPIGDQTYTGSVVTPSLAVSDGAKTLVAGADYSVVFANNTNPGTATATLTGLGNYSGTAGATFKIRKPLSGVTVAAIPAQTYTGSPITPALAVSEGVKMLVLGVDYSVVYSGNLNAGTATATLTGLGDYAATTSATFQINAKPISTVAAAAVPAQTFTGSAITPTLALTDGAKTLVVGVDYSVAYSGNINAGTATITVTGAGNYSGSRAVTFQIVAKPGTGLAVGPIAAQTYKRSPIQPTLSVTDGGRSLVAGIDYTLAYSGNVNAGTASVSVTGIGNYSGSLTATFAILPKTLPAAACAAVASRVYVGTACKPSPVLRDGAKTLVLGRDYRLSYSANVQPGKGIITITGLGNYRGVLKASFVILPRKISIGSLSAGVAKATVAWKASSGRVSGYQIAYRKAGSSAWRYLYVSGATRRTISGLVRGKSCSFKLRAYRTIGAKRYFGAWGSTRSVAVR